MDFSEKKALVAYFSTKGVTKEAAEGRTNNWGEVVTR